MRGLYKACSSFFLKCFMLSTSRMPEDQLWSHYIQEIYCQRRIIISNPTAFNFQKFKMFQAQIMEDPVDMASTYVESNDLRSSAIPLVAVTTLSLQQRLLSSSECFHKKSQAPIWPRSTIPPEVILHVISSSDTAEDAIHHRLSNTRVRRKTLTALSNCRSYEINWRCYDDWNKEHGGGKQSRGEFQDGGATQVVLETKWWVLERLGHETARYANDTRRNPCFFNMPWFFLRIFFDVEVDI